jgi:hypothetical protein
VDESNGHGARDPVRTSGDSAFLYGGPPWILGHRGSAWEAPENTLASLKRALAWGLDGIEYDLRACASGHGVLHHDARLERTTDGNGLLAERDLVELAELDAGLWFGRNFRGEPLPALADALALGAGTAVGVGGAGGVLEAGQAAGQGQAALRCRSPHTPPIHMVELKETGLVEELARALAPQLAVRVASFSRAACLEAQDAGLATMLLAERGCADDLEWIERRGLAAYGLGPGGWRTEELRDMAWPCERWAWGVDEPADLLALCRIPFYGFNTNEPARALAVRALARLCAPGTPYPIEVPPLIMEFYEGALSGMLPKDQLTSPPSAAPPLAKGPGPWRGSWSPVATVSNPFSYPVAAMAGFFARHGAFETRGLPVRFDLAPGESAEVPFQLSGGSVSPGGDPLFAVAYSWRAGPGRAAGSLLLDAPLRRLRLARVGSRAVRLTMLAEGAQAVPASITVRRAGRDLLLSLEHAGDLEKPHLVAILAGHLVRGGAGLRLRLPDDFGRLEQGLSFTCGIEGHRNGRAALRRWSGGLPQELRSGVPGRLQALAE